MSVREELITIAQQHGGTVHPEAALEWAAANADSGLYAAIDAQGLWDDDEAAEYGRLQFMRHIIKRVRVKITGARDEPISVRAFVSLDEDRNPDGGYREITAVLSNPDHAGALLAAALRELDGMQRRYQHLTELAEVFAAAARVKAKADNRRKKSD